MELLQALATLWSFSVFSQYFCEKGMGCEDCMRVACASFNCAGCFKSCAHDPACLLQKTWKSILTKDGNEQLRPHYFQIVAREGTVAAREWLTKTLADRDGLKLAQAKLKKEQSKEENQFQRPETAGQAPEALFDPATDAGSHGKFPAAAGPTARKGTMVLGTYNPTYNYP